MRLILIRHAETDGNKTHYVGREDLPLNATGRAQAEALARALARDGIDRVLSSPLQRARATAAPLAAMHALAVEVRAGLVEIDYGELQGLAKGARPFKLRKAFLTTPMPGGESLADVWRRLTPIAEELKALVAAGTVPAVVGHYWSNRMLFAMLGGGDLESALGKGGVKPANASAYAVEFAVLSGQPIAVASKLLHAPAGARRRNSATDQKATGS
ncbi:MAG: histidine phosphatase family protein [Gammaproteobacteria bacterium]|nr:histidine phosphatase family protein [Gammaproteobacteria bacterium]